MAFAYEPDEAAVLTDFSVTIPAGKTVALVGASGAGKTTAAALLSRFYDPSAGRITINGIDLRELDLASLRQQVAVVSQDTFLFDDTVLENIRFGCPNASREAVERAAKTANADAFIQSLPQGYDTEINELGQRLSGGQRQRICIARAVLRDAPILVLDEATSALDAESEAAVQTALNALMQQRTVLAIAHRLSTIQSADEILVLDKGHVVERGVHSDLMQLGGVYARVVSRQTDWTGASR